MKDHLTTAGGALAALAIAIQGGVIKWPSNKQEAMATSASAFLAIFGYLTNRK